MPAMLYKPSLYDDTCLLNEIINKSVFIVNKYTSIVYYLYSVTETEPQKYQKLVKENVL